MKKRGKKVTGNGAPELVRPQKVDRTKLIEALCQIDIPGSATHERRRNEVIRTVKTLDQLTEALNYEGYDQKRSSVYLRLLPRNLERWRESDTYTQHLLNFINPKILNIHLIFLQSSHDPALELCRKLLQFWGREEVTFHSRDDKAKVPIDIKAAKKQTPCLCIWNIELFCLTMISLLGSKHKLIPSL